MYRVSRIAEGSRSQEPVFRGQKKEESK